MIWLAGRSPEVLKRTNSVEINATYKLASIVLIPVLLGFCTFMAALSQMEIPLVLCMGGGFIWATVLLILERFLVSHSRSSKMNFGMFLRVLLACCVSLCLATMLELAVFSDAIGQEMTSNRIELEEEIYNKYDGKIGTLDEQLSTAQERVDQKWNDYRDELDGRVGSSSGQGGDGPIAKKKFVSYETEKQRYDDLEKRIEQQKERLIRKQEHELQSVQASYASGLLGRLQALHRIPDPIVWKAGMLLHVCMLLLELLPLIAKTSKTGRESLYYKVEDALDRQTTSMLEAREREWLKRLQSLSQQQAKQDTFGQSVEQRLTAFSELAQQLQQLAQEKEQAENKIRATVPDYLEQERMISRLHSVYDQVYAEITKMMEDLEATDEAYQVGEAGSS